MRRLWIGSAMALVVVMLRAGAARGQASDPVLPVSTVDRRHGVSEPYPAPQATTYAVLEEMASRASVMFVGTVTAVQVSGGDDARGDVATGVVAVSFLVDEGISGPAVGSTYVVREWAGLWRDAARYKVGDRRLMLLHAPGPWGLSSPVDGMDGAIPLTGGGAGQPADAAGVAMAGTSAAAAGTIGGGMSGAGMSGATLPLPVSRVDLRWIQARQMRTVALAGAPAAGPGETAAQPVGLGVAGQGGQQSAGLQGEAGQGAASAGDAASLLNNEGMGIGGVEAGQGEPGQVGQQQMGRRHVGRGPVAHVGGHARGRMGGPGAAEGHGGSTVVAGAPLAVEESPALTDVLGRLRAGEASAHASH